MDERERASKDLLKLRRMMDVFTSLGFDSKYPSVFSYVKNYAADAEHFFKGGDYFTSFGAANYAYGFMDAILVIEGKKDEHIF